MNTTTATPPIVTSRRVAYGTAAQVAGRLGGAALSVVALRLSTSYLGAERFGALMTATALLALVGTLADCGLVTTAGRELARHDGADARHILGVNLALRLSLAVVLAPVAVAIAFLLYPDQTDVRLAVLVLAPTLLAIAVQSTAEAVLVGRGRADLRALTDLGSKAALLLVVAAVVVLGAGWGLFLAATLLAACMGAVVALRIAARHVSPTLVFDTMAWRTALALALPLGVIQTLNVVYFKVDSVLISLWEGPLDVGHYAVAFKVIELVMALPTFLMLTLIPALAVADRARASYLVRRAVRVLALVAVPITLTCAALAPVLISVAAGPGFGPAVTPLRILLIGAAASFVSAAYGNALIATGQQRHLVRLAVTVVVTNVALNIVLIPSFGIAGAAMATAAAEILAMVLIARAFRSWSSHG